MRLLKELRGSVVRMPLNFVAQCNASEHPLLHQLQTSCGVLDTQRFRNPQAREATLTDGQNCRKRTKTNFDSIPNFDAGPHFCRQKMADQLRLHSHHSILGLRIQLHRINCGSEPVFRHLAAQLPVFSQLKALHVCLLWHSYYCGAGSVDRCRTGVRGVARYVVIMHVRTFVILENAHFITLVRFVCSRSAFRAFKAPLNAANSLVSNVCVVFADRLQR
jgi:hypothetical protein